MSRPSASGVATAVLGTLLACGNAAAQHEDHAQHAPTRPVPAAVGEAKPPRHAHDNAVGADQPHFPVPALTAADRAAAFPELGHGMEHASPRNWRVLLDHFEITDSDDGRGQRVEGEAWYGTDTDRLWLRAGVERDGGRTHHADAELLYGRSIGPWWDVVAGVRQDFEPGPSRTWGAIGIQGLAPGRFEVAATAYVGASGRTAAHLQLEYDLLLTNRLVLQPALGAWVHGEDDAARRIGSGLSSTETGLRLRYEVHRQFAPYIGIVRERRHGRSAELRRAAGADGDETQWVAGVRWWF
ncbi:copper resistance protein B [Luteimonas sp. MC1782]|uniref:copper resistance protein B n=1 Tax=Luteimonas sp. MC1782 TaxID=2760305 RepID=UPI001600054D|nr:copper resistance protein B [Luteimonas sp. MC1782]MBB1472005.1 copper resistance protein B [Luteimonas sp. MC1782]